jgi:hypothetical protein
MPWRATSIVCHWWHMCVCVCVSCSGGRAVSKRARRASAAALPGGGVSGAGGGGGGPGSSRKAGSSAVTGEGLLQQQAGCCAHAGVGAAAVQGCASTPLLRCTTPPHTPPSSPTHPHPPTRTHPPPTHTHTPAATAPRALRYADLGGVDDVLADIRELIEYPLKHPEVYRCAARVARLFCLVAACLRARARARTRPAARVACGGAPWAALPSSRQLLGAPRRRPRADAAMLRGGAARVQVAGRGAAARRAAARSARLRQDGACARHRHRCVCVCVHVCVCVCVDITACCRDMGRCGAACLKVDACTHLAPPPPLAPSHARAHAERWQSAVCRSCACRRQRSSAA